MTKVSGIFKEIFKALNKGGVKYIVVGGVAVNLHGYLRATGDLDILVLLETSNLEKVDKIMGKMGYGIRLPVSVKDLSNQKLVKKWLKEKGMTAFSFFPPSRNPIGIDILVEESMKFETIIKDAVIKDFGNIRIPVVSINDLIRMKKKANRHKDLADLEYLITLRDL